MTTQENTAPDMALARKLSAKTITGGNVRKAMILDKVNKDDANDAGNTDAEKPRVTKLFQVWGHAYQTKRGSGDNGPWVSLIGRFEAVNLADGVISTAPQCFLPEPAASMLATQLEATDGAGKRLTESLEFAFEIGVKPTATAIGYEYVTTPIVKPGGADPLANLRAKIPALAALPKPEAPAAAPPAAPPPAQVENKSAARGGKK